MLITEDSYQRTPPLVCKSSSSPGLDKTHQKHPHADGRPPRAQRGSSLVTRFMFADRSLTQQSSSLPSSFFFPSLVYSQFSILHHHITSCMDLSLCCHKKKEFPMTPFHDLPSIKGEMHIQDVSSIRTTVSKFSRSDDDICVFPAGGLLERTGLPTPSIHPSIHPSIRPSIHPHALPFKKLFINPQKACHVSYG